MQKNVLCLVFELLHLPFQNCFFLLPIDNSIGGNLTIFNQNTNL